MLRSLKNQVACLALLFLLQTPYCFAQISDKLDLQLNRNQSNRSRKVPVPRSGEFKLSLGSQMFDSNSTSTGLSAIELSGVNREQGLSAIDNEVFYGNTEAPGELKFHTRLSNDKKRFGPTITLNNSYTDSASGPDAPASEGLVISGESGRLKVYGEFEKAVVQQLPAVDSANYGEPGKASTLRGSIAEPENSENSEPTDKNSAMSSRYYLEAVYSFKPTLKGKVSFKRSMIDTFESEEKLQVEGIVEANRNVLIKAGYNNEVRPEVTEPRSSKDTKVWTEFILKF